jgi:hypothetical protein
VLAEMNLANRGLFSPSFNLHGEEDGKDEVIMKIPGQSMPPIQPIIL